MPEELEMIITKHIYNSLKERIRAGIYVVANDKYGLIVDIKHDGFKFEYYYSDYHSESFADYIRTGKDILWIVNEVIGMYKGAILKKVFYKLMNYRTQRNLGLIFCPTQYPMNHYIFVSLNSRKKQGLI